MTLSTIRNNPAKQKKVKTKKQKAIAATCAVAFWLLVWHVVSLCVGSELVLVSPVKVVQTLFTVIFDPDFLKTVWYSAARILGGFFTALTLGTVLGWVASRFWVVETLLRPITAVIKATPVASFIILVLLWFSGKNLSVIISMLITEIPFTGDKGIKLKDVEAGLASMEDFVAQLTPEELESLTHGDFVMDSPLGAKGNAAVMGGIIESLREKGVPPITTTDGPSGIRLQYYCSLLPCGTCLACTWDPALVESLYQAHGREMVQKGSDVLLGPGMNIHRNPLCGRNFEYFAEDPLLAGKTAGAMVRGIQKNGVSACPKHFACNNQETNREYNDSQVSQRALREIYLKGFEICIKEAAPHHIMTSYNKINGVWSHYNYDLCTTILRGEWGYGGSVMTDWWERPSADPDFENVWDSAYRVRSQVDVLMPGAVDREGSPDPSVLESYHKGGLTLAELQRGAKNVLGNIIKRHYLRSISGEVQP